MGDFLANWYLWTKSLHVVSVIAWMAGLFYLPRLYVYHVEVVGSGNPTDTLFQTMERRLLKAIMNPAMIATWIFGLALVFTPGIVPWSEIWPWLKAASVLGMTWFHRAGPAPKGFHRWSKHGDRTAISHDERGSDGSDAGDRLFGDREVLNGQKAARSRQD